MTKLMQKNAGMQLAVVGLLALGVVSVALAQRTSNQFRGVWAGSLSPDLVFGVPEEDVERLRKPVNFELRIFNRGRTELQFFPEEDEWRFNGVDVQLTEIGENGMIFGRVTGAADRSQNAFSLNLTKIDDETLLVDWSMLSTQSNLRYDGFDEIAFTGSDELKLTDD